MELGKIGSLGSGQHLLVGGDTEARLGRSKLAKIRHTLVDRSKVA